MQNLYSASQSKDLDLISQDNYSIMGSTLMEDASFSSYLLMKEDIAASSSVLFLAGGGNNGGDALAIARLAFLDGNRDIRIMLCDSGKDTDLRALQRQACEKLGIGFCDSIEGADLIIDGLFGIGLKGAPRAPYDALIEKINNSDAKVISLDVPSGLGDSVPFGKAIRADRTICMGVLKSALYNPRNRDYAGCIECTFPFFPDKAMPQTAAKLLDLSDLAAPALRGSAYKKTRGNVAILGGSGRYTGAVILAAKAAFHAGAGLVTVFTEERLVTAISKAVPSAMVTTYGNISGLDQFDAVLCGPGMGREHDNVLELALQNAKRLVIDADGIRALARKGLCANDRCILTPHLGEYSDLVKAFAPEAVMDSPQQWEETLFEVQAAIGATIVVKANTVYICDGKELHVVDGQNPSLGVAGSGDVLSGITAALSAREAKTAAKDAVIIHQNAGRLANEKLGYYSSDDLIRFIGKSFKN